MRQLRERLIRTAYEYPEMRRTLLPLLRRRGADQTYTENIATLPLEEALEYVETHVPKAWPFFEDTYVKVQERLMGALGAKRIDMPVIESEDIPGFKAFLDREHGVVSEYRYVEVQDLKPTQEQIWLDKIVETVQEHGPIKKGSPPLESVIIVSEEGFILDGHHRVASALLSDPLLEQKTLYVPLPIKELFRVGKKYSKMKGHKPKASLSHKCRGK